MNGLFQSIILGIVRNAATASGGWMVSQGYLTSNQLQGWAGSIIFLAGIAGTVYDKFAVKSKIATAASNPSSPVAVAAKQ